MDKKIPIGIENYQNFIDNKYLYIDKTLWIKEILDNGKKILFLPRPRRFE
ncbi:MAG: AAA family ATPase [Mycoplasmatales bacterium]